MFSFLISISCGVVTGLALYFGDVAGWGWSSFFGVLGFGVAQMLVGLHFQKRVKAGMNAVQAVLVDGQKRLQAKASRWQMNPPGSVQQAQAEMMKDQTFFVKEALALTESLHKFDNWVPLMKRQIATAQFQLHWMIREFKQADALMPKALFLDPNSCAIKMARMQMLNKPIDEIGKVYRKAVARARYNQNVLPAAVWSWILVKRGDVDGAFKALNDALKNSDNETLKQNRDHLANNRLTHFSNAGIGDQWYALFLEEPRHVRQRQHVQWR